jgi:hypothetical protein
LTWDFIQAHPEISWVAIFLSQHKCITWDIIQANPGRQWDWFELSRNPNMTWKIVQENPDKPWDYEGLCRNPNITWEIVLANPDKPWRCSILSFNPNITWDIIKANLDKPWNMSAISARSFITWDIVKNNLDMNWNWTLLSRHKSITMNIVNANMNPIPIPHTWWKLWGKKKIQPAWSWFALSKNPNITPNDVKANHDKPWSLHELSSHPNFFLKDFIECTNVCSNPNINDIHMINHIGINANLTLQCVLSHPNVQWNWQEVSRNPNVTKLQTSELAKVVRRFIAACKIQSAFLEAYYNPDYKLCRDRLNREYNAMVGELDHALWV